MNTPEKAGIPFSWKARGRSFRYAFRGFRTFVKEEHNARIHLVAGVLAVALGFALGISAAEWCVVVLCIGIVFAGECINSAVEAVCDLVSPEYSPFVKKAKDVAACAVLLLAAAALVCGVVIFLPKLIALIYDAF